jgi:hypothetical protein
VLAIIAVNAGSAKGPNFGFLTPFLTDFLDQSVFPRSRRGLFCVRITGVEKFVKGQRLFLSRGEVLSLNKAFFQK